jgi:DNA-binding LytR/AlgR family response regulator
MKINCIVIDDSLPAVEKLAGFIREMPGLQLLKSFNNGKEAIVFMKNAAIDLIFLDIQMEEMDGLELLEQLPFKPCVVIVSAYSEYAVKGYDYAVSDYLLKPYSFSRFKQAVEKVMDEIGSKPQKDFIFVKTEYRMERVDFADILYIEGQGGYLRIITTKSKIMTLQNFQTMESSLPLDNFMRVHKSYIVALNKIEQIERNRIRINKEQIPVGNSYREKLYHALKIKE